MQREKPPREKQMSDPWPYPAQLPPEQEGIRAKCFHPLATFVEFSKEELGNQSPSGFWENSRPV